MPRTARPAPTQMGVIWILCVGIFIDQKPLSGFAVSKAKEGMYIKKKVITKTITLEKKSSMLLTEGSSKGLRNEFKIFITAINEAMVSQATKNICLTFFNF
tara:strand:- start:583 stop:885 length:303 start_codon:yes stop_codon:yes gene_type:complete